MINRNKWWGQAHRRQEIQKENPYANGCPEEILQRQAEQYAKLFRLFVRQAKNLDRITFWGLTDGESWLNGWPWKRMNHPLLFDRKARPKPAFFSVAKALKS